MTLRKANVHTISGLFEIIERSWNATIISPNDTILHLKDALLICKSKMNLFNIQDVRYNEYCMETLNADIIVFASFLIS